ncbi:XdhC family protein [Acidicapsa acidisoli]|uniref:XdhC family protein n=1 Tax=Acidicapsa acidisoli TaxID=1615681 RepID=UPI0021E097EC|nr:XdhC/CoxI family protein [Acidicapsa acidisoli]
MTDLEQILPLWQDLRKSATEYVLATVVKVEGSGYRKTGARMLIAADGRRVGTISGGCLEAEVARKAFWRTEDGPVVRRYSTSAEDGDVPYGMGCGGIVHVLLERSATADALLKRLAVSFHERTPLAISTVLDGEWIGHRAYCGSELEEAGHEAGAKIGGALSELAYQSFQGQRSFAHTVETGDGRMATVGVEWNAARPGLFVFGAGDDAIPLVRQARQLGWYVAVADGRSHLVTQTRFPEANHLQVLRVGEPARFTILPTDAATVMTHSLEQDTRILTGLLEEEPAYIGVLGPRRRTYDMLFSIAQDNGVPDVRVDSQVERWMEQLHAPMGLDLGGNSSAEIALAVIAEIQQDRHRTSGLSLRTIRARHAGLRKITA